MQKKAKNLIRALCVGCSVLCVALFCSLYLLDAQLPDRFQVRQGDVLENIGNFPVKAMAPPKQQYRQTQNALSATQNRYRVQLKLFGVFPVSDASVNVVDEKNVQLAGEPFGIKIYTQGVLVVGMTDVDTQQGLCNPARDAGIRQGDVILSINGTMVNGNQQVAQLIEASHGKTMQFIVERDGTQIQTGFAAQYSVSEQKYRAGIWVRDSSAGIGTLTFYDPVLKTVAGLGHGICDVDTGELLPISTGELVNAQILSINKGEKGIPGELVGCFQRGSIGALVKNDVTGVYGTAEAYPQTGELTPVAMKQEVKEGEAQILSTVCNGEKKYYSCNIEKVRLNDDSLTQNMVIRITDPELLALTGGIVQGMSGSPIIQNGKLVGAVTHVLVNDPTKGYGIFAENMLETAQSVSENNKLKDAS